MENNTMMREQVEKSFSESPQVSSAGREGAEIKKAALFARQDAEARAIMYRFLAAVYLISPNEDLLRHMLAMDFLAELSTFLGQEAVADLKQFAATADLDKVIAFLKQEYMDLFAVPTGRYVIPFEDVYLGRTSEGKQERGPLMGQRAIAVRKMFRKAGAQMDQACKELPTHIGVELAFMSFLCERESAKLGGEEGKALPDQKKRNTMDSVRYRELQIRFLQKHLNAWFPQLNQSIQANAKTQFYRGLASITAAFLVRDTANLLAQSVSKINVRVHSVSIRSQTE
jgi:TorA maturation chaperone TorD